ncbi:hypothetical protein [Pseudomonas sp.]
MSSTWGETAALDNQEGCLLVTAQSAVLAASATMQVLPGIPNSLTCS